MLLTEQYLRKSRRIYWAVVSRVVEPELRIRSIKFFAPAQK